MMTLEQAKANLQTVIDGVRLNKQERDILETSLGLLYTKATDNEDAKVENNG